MSENKFLSNLTLNYPVSGIRAMFDLAVDYPGAINLCNGEPNFETPEHIRESCIKTLREGRTKYGTEPGLPAMREAVARKYTKQFGRAYDINNVMVTLGGVEGIFMSLMTILNPGDEVIIPDPAYTCYVGQTLTLGGVPVRVPLYEEHGFRLQPEDLERAITPKTKAIIITYPSTWLPSYGAEMRGGTANCNVVISDEEIPFAMVAQADYCIIMNDQSLEKFESKVCPGGTLILDSSIISRSVGRTDITVYSVPADTIAEEEGNTRGANMVLLGAYLAAAGGVKLETVCANIDHSFTGSKAKYAESNKRLVKRGYDLIAAQTGR